MDRGVEQLVARRAHNPKVAGSSPAPATRASLKAEEKERGQHQAGPFLFLGLQVETILSVFERVGARCAQNGG